VERQDGKQMIFVLPHFWIIFLDIFLWLVIHLGISYACSKIPIRNFVPNSRFYRPKSFEKGGKLYTGIFKIKKWKNAVPDGAKLFRGGFPKKNLEQCSQDYLMTFALETCRGELTHWLQILPSGIFFLWNIWWAGIIMIIYALCVNIPCILLQRYNRARLMRVT
jgi:glycosyl-4,4'-diaponeurosporenoate acyltransferase